MTITAVRGKAWIIVAAVVTLTSCTGAAQPAAPPTTGAPPATGAVTSVAALAQASVVKILTAGGNGSGVVYGADGLILTNEHVVRGAQAVQVAFADGQRVPGTIRAVDVVTDLALVQVARTGLPPARFQPQLPAVGELVVVIGSPLGFENSVTAGVVSGLHREIPGSAAETQALVDLIQTDAPISPGSSGGAVFNAAGEVVGISEAYIPPQAGAVSLGFAIPAATAVDVTEQLMSTGRARHAFAGLEPAQLTPQIAAQLRLPRADGVIVAAIADGGPAAAAGLQPGDVVTALDGTAVRTPEEFLGQLRRRDPGDTVTVTFHRAGGQDVRTPLTLTDRPAFSS
ncbi:S1C family serine protease [Amycolatopsis thermoflava]|uniref:S1-C subfamily serine protease n=1 Tax=Amycolatopsis thermoflava TaxID=84480 RepID=A0A3N2H440_9PSEU|nr:trypsin-like peptidase domain-containing protein [Amycolatopsis thermoflava]ROS43688.1 S1-C subfamily serine protease [Amycolatopsis thermoflava]